MAWVEKRIRDAASNRCPAVISSKNGQVRCAQAGQGRCELDVLNLHGQGPLEITSGVCLADVRDLASSSPVSQRPFAPESRLFPLNAYFAVSEEDRPMMMQALIAAARTAPTVADSHSIGNDPFLRLLKGTKREVEIENMYRDIVNAYEEDLIPDLPQERRDLLKSNLYTMIRTLSREDLRVGVMLIRHAERTYRKAAPTA